MKTCSARIAAVAVVVFACANISNGSTLAYYSFNDLTASDSFLIAPRTISPTSSEIGAATNSLLVNPPLGTSTAFGGTTSGTGGTTTNRLNTTPVTAAGIALSLKGGNGTNNGDYVTFTISDSMLRFSDITLSYATQQSTAGGFNSQKLSYSGSDGVWIDYSGDAYVPTLSYTTATFNLGSIAALTNQSTVKFRLTFDGATTTGANNIDNVQIIGTAVPTAVPLPPAVLAGTALLGVVGFLKRRRPAIAC